MDIQGTQILYIKYEAAKDKLPTFKFLGIIDINPLKINTSILFFSF